MLDRESLTTTGVGFRIAIPHGKTDAVREASVAFARLAKPIDWEAMDGKPVDTVFQLTVPDNSKGDAHLQLLSALSRRLIHTGFRDQIRLKKSLL